MKRVAFMSMSVFGARVELSVLDFIDFNVLQGCGHSLSLSVCTAPYPPLDLSKTGDLLQKEKRILVYEGVRDVRSASTDAIMMATTAARSATP